MGLVKMDEPPRLSEKVTVRFVAAAAAASPD